MFTPKPKSTDLFDVTILSTPQPQASSTVQRKNTLESRYVDREVKEGNIKETAKYQSNTTQRSDESSLGILDNISSFLTEVSEMDMKDKQDESKLDLERELARRLLQRCSDFKVLSGKPADTNKENDVNVQNLTVNISSSIVSNPRRVPHDSKDISQQDSMGKASNKTGATSVIFEPNEITARSSGLSRSSDKNLLSLSDKETNVISFNTTTAELMAQFGNEEFRSASQMASQMLADEASWEQNCSYAIPTAPAAEKEYLDLSCFSGVIGELDLSVESCAGHKVPVDEFFRRKCGNIGGLLDGGVERPSIGLSVKSPKRKEKLVSLVDTSIMTEASSVVSSSAKQTTQPVPNMTKDVQEQSIMSLSSIAQALQDIDNCTPRRLVDQLIMAKKKRKSLQMQGQNVLADTYTLPSDRKSMPATPSFKIQNIESSTGTANLSAKLSLDSKTLNETSDVKHKIPRILSFESELDVKAQDILIPTCSQQTLKKETNDKSVMCLYDQNLDLKMLLEDSNLPVKENSTMKLSPLHSLKLGAKLAQEKKSDVETQEIKSKGAIKQENISYKCKADSSIQEASNAHIQTNNVVIGRNTEELCNCIVGVLRETDIELLNKSDRWIICSLNLNQIQGDKQNIELKLPEDVILIKPNSARFVKIGAKVIKMGKPIITVLNVTVSDMVTRSEWTIKHIICYKPEELNVHIPMLSQTQRLDFRSVAENCIETLAITFENRNSLKIPIKLSIAQDDPKVFSIENTLIEQTNISEHCDELNFIAQPQEIMSVNINCKGIVPMFGQAQERYRHRYEGKLCVQMPRNDDHALTIVEIPIVVEVGTCKIELIDTDTPITIPFKQTKTLNIINRGSIPVSVSAFVTSNDEHANDIKDFLITPETLLVKCNEIGVFNIAYKPQISNVSKRNAKVNFIAGGNAYCYSIIGEHNSSTEIENDNLLRCETPQYLSSVSSPTSPQSVSSNRLEFCGRNSPSSSVSGSTVVGDKIPIRATHAALAWNSIKAGKSEIKEFTIRNTSNNKIKIQAVISDNDKSFKFIRDGQAVGTGMLLVLQRTESRTLSIMFSPHRVGAAAGKIIFRHYEPKKDDNESRPNKIIVLYGYGGYGKVEISEAFKDMSGKMWLSLGTLTSGSSLNAKIKLQNNGDLYAFAKIKLTPKALYPTMVSSWNVNPTELLLRPKEVQWVTLEFHPRKEDLVLLQRSDVSHVGTVNIIHGDEPTRWRIRRLCNKMKEIGELSGNESEAFRSTVHPICKAFPGEQQISDINIIRDSTQNLGELCRGVCQHEIMLTTEVCPDETLSILHDNPDDSQMFYSLCSDNSHMYDGSGESFLPFETTVRQDVFNHNYYDDHFAVNPSIVVLNPPMKTEAIITILSSCNVAQPFETKLSSTEYLSVIPAEGMIPARRDFPLKIQCKQNMERNLETLLEIYTENDKKVVQIKVNCKGL
ncbi:hypothetical protein KM043_009059 [Ampulex compressa]|nr:hypothetical protein KM043_009059 [Ampulex compressa]